ncbi:MAG: hypothetical protein ABSG74_13860 [Candidatus Bathyarchaeia archaeon]|jgi:titin
MPNVATNEKRARRALVSIAGVRTFVRFGGGSGGLGLWLLCLAVNPARASTAATLVVSNTLDSGNGSLRQALVNANATAGPDTISFRIPGVGAHTIRPHSALPAVSDPVVIDGTTQPGFAGYPLIELDGASAGNSIGLRLISSNSVVRGLAINRFAGGGLRVEGPGGNSIQGSFVGMDVKGTTSRPNGQQGVLISSSWGNVIGGTNAADRNVISASSDAGIYLYNGGSNVVLGNFIGTTAAGRTRLGNGNNGVAINDSRNNVIGGATPGAWNIISGNTGSGVYLLGAGSTGNLVQGNYLGTDVTGSLALGNTDNGVTLSGAAANVIGGTNAGAGNVISGNGEAGIFLSGAGATNNLVQGNHIGTQATGRQALGNSYAGITILEAGGNLIGGTVAGAGNVISGNKQDGIFITNSVGNVVQGNYIGTDVTGRAAVGNGLCGLRLYSGANKVGGAVSGARNVISGNGLDGVWLVGTAAVRNRVAGNFIGPDASGTNGLGNGRAGVGISKAPGNAIGDAEEGAGNVISANHDAGVYLIGSGASHNLIWGNKLGTDVTGMAAMGNAYEGVYIQDAGTNFIGGPTPGAGNLISANHTLGIQLTNNAAGNVIQGNWIGTKSDGVSGLGNVYHGVECQVGANNNLIGGAGGAGNRIAYASTALYAGVRLRDGSANNAILANSIFANAGLGIDLGPNGTNSIVPCDAGTAGKANLSQNYPVLGQAVTGLNGTGVRGTLNSRPNSVFLLQFFANPLCDPSGCGEGQLYLGDQTVATGADCNAGFVALLTNPAPAGWVITATATDAANNTSEFSACVPVLPVPTLTVMHRFDAYHPGLGPNRIILSWSNTATLVLKETSKVAPPVRWTTSTNVPLLTSSNWWVLALTNPPANKFYRLSFE